MAKRRGEKAPRFENVGEIEARIDAYFEECRGEVLTESGKVVLDKRSRPVMSGERPPTLTGLALALGFTSRAGMLNYRGKAEYEDAILRGRSRVEQYAEEQLFDKETSAGAKFVLENDFQGWRFAGDGEDEGDDGIMDEVRARMRPHPSAPSALPPSPEGKAFGTDGDI